VRHRVTQNASIAKPLVSGQGIYHGSINYETSSEDHIDTAQLLQYPLIAASPGNEQSKIPISLSVTEFHFVLLYDDRIAAICNLDEKKTYEEILPIVRPRR